MERDDILQTLYDTKVVAIIRGMELHTCYQLAKAFFKGGIRLVEVTFDQTGDPKDTLRAIDFIKTPGVGQEIYSGAGTVLTAEQCMAAIEEGGADFIVAPNVNPDMIRFCSRAGIPVFPGAYTPTEIVTAHEAGADVVKVFPARSLGPQYFKDVLAPLKHIPLMAVGGITPDNAADYLRAGCVAVGASGSLVNKEWIEAEAWDKIAAEAARLVENCKNA